MIQQDGYIGYHVHKCCDCSENLGKASRQYIMAFNITPYYTITPGTFFYANMLGFKNSFWTDSDGMFHYLDYMDYEVGGNWKYRWSEQVLYAMGISFYAPFDKLTLLDNVTLMHYFDNSTSEKSAGFLIETWDQIYK